MEMQRITDQYGNSWLHDPNTGDVYQDDGLSGFLDFLKPKAGGSAVGNLFRKATSSKNVQALVGRGAQSLTNRIIQRRNGSTGAASAPSPFPTYNPQTPTYTPQRTVTVGTSPAKDNTMLYVAGGVGVLVVATIAVVAAKSGNKGK